MRPTYKALQRRAARTRQVQTAASNALVSRRPEALTGRAVPSVHLKAVVVKKLAEAPSVVGRPTWPAMLFAADLTQSDREQLADLHALGLTRAVLRGFVEAHRNHHVARIEIDLQALINKSAPRTVEAA